MKYPGMILFKELLLLLIKYYIRFHVKKKPDNNAAFSFIQQEVI